jgi:hypothetical protein
VRAVLEAVVVTENAPEAEHDVFVLELRQVRISLEHEQPIRLERRDRRGPAILPPTLCEETMRNTLLRSLLLFCALSFASYSATAWAAPFRYRYVSLDNPSMPEGFAGFSFVFATVDRRDRVYGSVCDHAAICYGAVYEDGALTVIKPRHASPLPFNLFAVKSRSIVGGTVPDPLDPAGGLAAILRHGEIEVLPVQQGATYSFVFKFTDLGPIVDSFDVDGNESFTLVRSGITPLDLSQVGGLLFVDANKSGIFAATDQGGAFRIDPFTNTKTRLDPLPSEPSAWAIKINDRGDVLGYSFVFGGLERIGVWDSANRFHTYFIEGTPEFPTISNRLLFNDENLIVITAANDGHSYIVPQPGQRLNLADLTENLPAEPFPLSNVQAINQRGSLVGYGSGGQQFLLQRIDGDDHCEKDRDDQD